MGPQGADIDNVLAQLEAQGKVPGRPCNITPIYAQKAYGQERTPSEPQMIMNGGCPDPMGFDQGANGLCVPGERTTEHHEAAMAKIGAMFCTNSGCMTNNGDNKTAMGVIDLTTEIAAGGDVLTKALQALVDNGQDKTVIAINGGDEINLDTHLVVNNTQFQAYLQKHNVSLAAVGCAQTGESDRPLESVFCSLGCSSSRRTALFQAGSSAI